MLVRSDLEKKKKFSIKNLKAVAEFKTKFFFLNRTQNSQVLEPKHNCFGIDVY